MRKVYTSPAGEKQYNRPKSIVIKDKSKSGLYIYSPSDSQLQAAGWTITEEIDPIPEPYLPTIEELTEQKLRERYSINQEFEVQRKRDVDSVTFNKYFNYVEECIAWAKSQPHRVAKEGE